MEDSDDETGRPPILKKPKKSTTAGGALKIDITEGLTGIKLKRQELKQQKKERKLKKLLKQRTRPEDESTKTDIPKPKSKVSNGQGQKSTSNNPKPVANDTGRSYSVSIAIPGSIIDNAQSPPLKAYLAGQVARAVAIFNVDEVIIYDDTGGGALTTCEFMARILQFLECPQYLRKSLFSLHPDLQYTGLIAPLDIPHHLRRNEVLPYRLMLHQV